jgi:ELWxxDGT repeat protein
VNGTLFFRAYEPSSGGELWKSDGTEAGTALVKDIFPGSDWSFPEQLTSVDGMLFFQAYDPTNGVELWSSDGTEGGRCS